MSTRREFLRTLGSVGTVGWLTGLSTELLGASMTSMSKAFQPVKFGIIADIHRDLTPDADERLEAFMKKVDEEKPDFLMSLGDFAHPIAENERFVRRFASSKSPVYHVLGNHEMDRADKKTAVAFLHMPSAFYSFDIGGYHCVVLDPNYIYTDGKFLDYEKANYYGFTGKINYINDEQCEWLEADLRKTHLPTFLFSHQSLDNSIANREQVRQILERENERCGFQKILGCFNGHHHTDFHRIKNNIHYFGINSVSYLYHREDLPGRYSEEMSKKLCCPGNISMYRNPLFCFVTIDTSGRLSLRGVKSEWMVTPPAGVSDASPNISDRDVVLS